MTYPHETSLTKQHTLETSGRHAILGSVDEIWWPEINRQNVEYPKTSYCQKADKSLKSMKKQKEFRTLEEPIQVNERSL